MTQSVSLSVSRLQVTCIVGHAIGFVILLMTYFSPYWVITHLPLTNSTWHIISIGPIFYLDEQMQDNGTFSLEFKLLNWNEFDGNLPGWVNITRLLVSVSLLFQMVTIIVNSIVCLRLKVTRFVVQGILSFIAVIFSIAAYGVFAIHMRNQDFSKESIRVFWSFYLAVSATVVIFVSAILSFCARNSIEPVKDTEETLFAINSESYRHVGYYPSSDPDIMSTKDYGSTATIRSSAVLTNLL